MGIDFSEIQANFKAKNDEELLSLSSEASGMTPESRSCLVEELQRRFQAIKDCTASIQLVHGFYTVFVPGTNLHFPDICPNCLCKGADTPIETLSQTKTRYRVVYVKELSFPYCVNCAKQVRRRRRLISMVFLLRFNCLVNRLLEAPPWTFSRLLGSNIVVAPVRIPLTKQGSCEVRQLW
jgi:hypothetical protein